jgi:hypothetical protein
MWNMLSLPRRQTGNFYVCGVLLVWQYLSKTIPYLLMYLILLTVLFYLIFPTCNVFIALPERFQELYKWGGGLQQHENCVDLCTSSCNVWVRG